MTPKPTPPFARIERRRENNHERVALYVAERFIASEPEQPRETLPEIAAEICAAVEAREAVLVAALRGMVDAVNRHVDGERDGITRAIAAAWDALEGAGPDLVAELRAQVEALKATSGPWMVLNDLAQTGGLASERAGALMEALGLRPGFAIVDLVRASDDALLGEVNRRGLARRIVAAGMSGAAAAVAPTDPDLARAMRGLRGIIGQYRACPHCNDMPYRGRTPACPECGIDRHGVGHGAG